MIIPQGIAEKVYNGALGLLVLLSFIFSSAGHTNTRVEIILSGNNPAYRQLAQSIERSLSLENDHHIQLDYLTLKSSSAPSNGSTQANLVVAIGSGATRYALKNYRGTPVISTFVTRDSAQQMLNSQKADSDSSNSKIIAAIVLDQPADRLIQLARLIRPDATTVGALTGPLSNSRSSELDSAAKQVGLTFNYAKLGAKDNPVLTLETIMSRSQVYLVVPDSTEFNRLTAKWIIYLGHRYRIPIIGYSSRYADAGALVSIFSTPEQIGRQTAELMLQQLQVHQQRQGQVAKPEIKSPAYFKIKINHKVKRSLGLKRLNEKKLQQALSAAEPPTERLNRKMSPKPRGLGD